MNGGLLNRSVSHGTCFCACFQAFWTGNSRQMFIKVHKIADIKIFLVAYQHRSLDITTKCKQRLSATAKHGFPRNSTSSCVGYSLIKCVQKSHVSQFINFFYLYINPKESRAFFTCNVLAVSIVCFCWERFSAF